MWHNSYLWILHQYFETKSKIKYYVNNYTFLNFWISRRYTKIRKGTKALSLLFTFLFWMIYVLYGLSKTRYAKNIIHVLRFVSYFYTSLSVGYRTYGYSSSYVLQIYTLLDMSERTPRVLKLSACSFDTLSILFCCFKKYY